MVKKKRKPRKCGACGDIGHDKRTCTAQPVWGSTTAARIIKAEEPKKSPKQTLEELRQEETENTLSALVSLVNDYASAAGVIDAEEIEQAKSMLPDNVFKELYLAEPSDDGGNPFGQNAILDCVAPQSNNSAVIFGVDLAKSVDYTVAVGLDIDGRVSEFERFQAPWEETCRRLASRIGFTSALVDSTGVGDPIVERLQRDLPNVSGFHFSSSSKQKLMEGLALAIQTQSVHYPDGPIVSELDAFSYEYTRTGVRYSAPSGLHDDCVMALALAVHAQTNVAGEGVW